METGINDKELVVNRVWLIFFFTIFGSGAKHMLLIYYDIEPNQRELRILGKRLLTVLV